jgi:heme exporter protein D
MGANAEDGGMTWGSVNEFLAMGGYGLYVWGSYGVTILCIAVEIWTLRK